MWRTILLTGENANDHDIALANDFEAAIAKKLHVAQPLVGAVLQVGSLWSFNYAS
jgi:hypothetical protein